MKFITLPVRFLDENGSYKTTETILNLDKVYHITAGKNFGDSGTLIFMMSSREATMFSPLSYEDVRQLVFAALDDLGKESPLK